MGTTVTSCSNILLWDKTCKFHRTPCLPAGSSSSSQHCHLNYVISTLLKRVDETSYSGYFHLLPIIHHITDEGYCWKIYLCRLCPYEHILMCINKIKPLVLTKKMQLNWALQNNGRCLTQLWNFHILCSYILFSLAIFTAYRCKRSIATATLMNSLWAIPILWLFNQIQNINTQVWNNICDSRNRSSMGFTLSPDFSWGLQWSLTDRAKKTFWLNFKLLNFNMYCTSTSKHHC